MSDIVRLLPDSVSNQIAAGEVIQRPASVVKELVENAIDAGSTEITVIIKDSGKSLIQVIDNGSGMSETDARMSFERHATSKISEAGDLYSIKTLGFRGEALASVAAVAQVELKTRKTGQELGTLIRISATSLESQEAAQCPPGSNISVMNLFFNVPARRKFLKKDLTEFNHILEELRRVAMAHENIAFSLYHNNAVIYNLPVSNIRQRIVNIFGKSVNQALIPVKSDTSLVRIGGFVGKPEFAKKSAGEQYFFVNGRFMKHPYFHRAISEAYNKLLPPDSFPSYFIYFEIDPSMIDVNIHPTKTEIKFEDETNIWRILMVVVKETLGKFNVTPSLDFTDVEKIEIPVLKKDAGISAPKIEVDPDYNPFREDKPASSRVSYKSSLEKDNLANWDKLYSGFEKERQTDAEQANKENHDQQEIESFGLPASSTSQVVFQFRNKYIITPVKSGLMIIDQHLAHVRILYDHFLSSLNNNAGNSQMLLYPVTIALNPSDSMLLTEFNSELKSFGFEIENSVESHFIIQGVPADIPDTNVKEVLEKMISNFKDSYFIVNLDDREKLAFSLALSSAIGYGKSLKTEEMNELLGKLFVSSSPNFSPNGKPVISILSMQEIEEKMR
ncbi:MAG: DNA mismatch repair endonuclease MutL [Bacteroidia bacterium]|nr:DNA mismatch repair endonuclease MutL [Bacteroidia bacterium]